MKNVAIIAKRNSDFSKHIQQLIRLLKELKCHIFCDAGLNNILDDSCCVGDLDDWVGELDLAIIIGGDGTLLSVGRTLAHYRTPIMGINFGGLGFMTDVSVNDMLTVIKEVIVDKNYYIETRSLLLLQIYRRSALLFQSVAINDLVLSAKAASNLIEFEIFVDKEFMCAQRADGVIVTTPTGSTAYALAAGGSIIHPHTQAVSIVPICPQSLSNRPVLLPDSAHIEIKLTENNRATSSTQICIDGQEAIDVYCRDVLSISKASENLNLLHYNGNKADKYNYFATLRTKLNWSKKNID